MSKMVEVRYKTKSAGPKGTIYPGDVLAVPEDEAALMVSRNYVELVNANGGHTHAPQPHMHEEKPDEAAQGAHAHTMPHEHEAAPKAARGKKK